MKDAKNTEKKTVTVTSSEILINNLAPRGGLKQKQTTNKWVRAKQFEPKGNL